jgi:hypothetical protein
MRKLAALAAFLLAAAAPPQDPPGMRGPDDPKHPRAPKMPAEHKSSGCCEEGRAKPWPLYNKGVQWTQPFDAAVKKARETGKLLMIFHLVGDMSREGC